jgi:hypothetical protein
MKQDYQPCHPAFLPAGWILIYFLFIELEFFIGRYHYTYGFFMCPGHILGWEQPGQFFTGRGPFTLWEC